MSTRERKKTIPDGWSLQPVGDVFTFVKSYAFSRDNLVNGTVDDEGIGNIHYGDIHSKFTSPSIDLRQVSIPTIKDQSFAPKKEELLKDGDLIMADASEDYAGVGVTVSVHGLKDRKVVGGLHTFVLRDVGGKTDEYYRQYIFRNPAIRNALQKIANGVSVYGISKTALSKVLLPLPPLPEQHRIVSILETWDNAINDLGKKIELKGRTNDGLMQNILSEKVRLPGFTEPWKIMRLNEIGIFSKGFGIAKTQVVGSGNCAIRYGEIYTRHHIQVKNILSFISDEVARSAKKIQQGDILFAGSGETIDEIGKSVAYLKSETCFAGGDLVIFSPKDSDSLFLALLLNAEDARKKLRELGQGQSVVHVYKKDLENFSISIPSSRKEQAAIANIYSTFDSEVELLERKLKNLKYQKSYLLNALMTGSIRTPETTTVITEKLPI